MLRQHTGLVLCLTLALFVSLMLATIAAAVSVRTHTWTPYAANPVLRADPGSWEQGQPNRPAVVKVGDEYWMYYDDLDWAPSRIGLAISSDKITWRKRLDVSPVIPGWFYGQGVGKPSVIVDNGVFKMWFDAGNGGIGYATSTDGEIWAVYPRPVFTPDWRQEVWAGTTVKHTSVLKDEAGYRMYYVGFHGSILVSHIGVATSTNGITWTRYISNPIISPDHILSEASVLYPYVARVDELYHMWYYAYANVAQNGIVHATSPDGFVWTSEMTYTLASAAAPSVLEEQGILHMWYRQDDGQYPVGVSYASTGSPPQPTPTTTPTPTATPAAVIRLPVILKSVPYHTPTPTPTPSPTPGWQTIVKETFEGGYPGFYQKWRVFDGNGIQKGEYYWGERNCRPLDGVNSGWAVGAGWHGAALPCGSDYPDFASSWMVYGPFGLDMATAADFRFNVWVNSERGVDGICWLASINDRDWYGHCGSGNSQGWTDVALDLADVPQLGNLLGGYGLFVAIAFLSDQSGRFAEGAYVDNVLVQQCVTSHCPRQARSAPAAPAEDMDDMEIETVHLISPW